MKTKERLCVSFLPEKGAKTPVDSLICLKYNKKTRFYFSVFAKMN